MLQVQSRGLPKSALTYLNVTTADDEMKMSKKPVMLDSIME